MNNRFRRTLDTVAFLSRVGVRRKVVELAPEEFFFTQGDTADCVYCLEKGRGKLSVLSGNGKQATITFLSPGDFFGEDSLAMSTGRRVATAMAVNTCTALKISRDDLTRIMHENTDFSDMFLSFLVQRTMRMQADLVDHIFNSSEKRLARTLLLMAEESKLDEPRAMIPPITQEALAEMVGTTRSRVSFFMNRFRSLGLISYTDRIKVHRQGLEAVLQGQFAEV